MTYTQYTGPRERRRRRSRRLKAAMLAVLLAALAAAASWAPPRDPPAAALPLPSELAVARNYYAASGDNGYAHEYLLQWPQYAAYIRGEVDSIEDCE